MDKFSDLIKKSAILSLPYKIIAQRMIDWEFPQHLFLETTNACNLKCKMCVRNMVPLKIGEMDFDLFKKILDESSNHGPRNFSLHLFGDPLLASNLVKIIKYIKFKNKKNTILLTTNGVLLTKDKAEEIITNNVDKIIISIHSANGDKYKDITGIDMLGKVEENIKDLVEIKKKHKENTSQIYLRMVVPDKKSDDVKFFRDKWKTYPVIADVRELHNYGGKIYNKTTETMPIKRYPCYHLWFSPGISWDGEVSICCDDLERQAVIGNIKKSTLTEIWQSDALKKYREYHLRGEYQKIPVCKNCDVWKTYPDVFFKWQKK
ncbi:MAG: SPASM domain-containing protein [Candidatus Paceibacter sp.]|nr:SPASM domain-containing protein [Candidatus Paceibacter sp.]